MRSLNLLNNAGLVSGSGLGLPHRAHSILSTMLHEFAEQVTLVMDFRATMGAGRVKRTTHAHAA
jgi:hypothetical protein